MSAPDDEEPAVKMATLAVRVIMGDRTDPRGANVVIRDAPGQLVASGSPDRGGIYSPPRRLRPGLYQIEVTKTGYAMRGGDVILAGRDLEKPFELPPLGGREEPPVVTKPEREVPGVQSTVVEVLDLRSGAPLDGAQVVIGLGDPEWPREQHYGKPKRGERPNWYYVEGLRRANYWIRVDRSGYRRYEHALDLSQRMAARYIVRLARIPVSVPPGDEGPRPGPPPVISGGPKQDMPGTTKPPQRITVQVKAVENTFGGRGVPGAWIQVIDPRQRQTVHRQQVNEGGLASFGLPRGQYDMIATPNRGDRRHREGRDPLVVPAPDPRRAQEVRMPTTGGGGQPPPPPPQTVEVQVQAIEPAQRNQGVGGAHITIEQGGKPVAGLNANGAGAATFQLKPGEYAIVARKSGYDEARAGLVVGPRGGRHQVPMRKTVVSRPPDQGTLTVVVLAERGGPIDGATVRVGNQQGQTRGGRWQVTLPIGDYSVSVSKQHYKPQRKPVHVGKGQVEARFVLTGGIQ